jgi:hypothetical protein
MTFFEFEPIADKESGSDGAGNIIIVSPDELTQLAKNYQELATEINERLEGVTKLIDAIPDDLGGNLFCVLDDAEEFFQSLGQLITLLSVFLYTMPLDEETETQAVKQIGEILLLSYSYGFWAGTKQEEKDVPNSTKQEMAR